MAVAADIPLAPTVSEPVRQEIKPDGWRFSASPYFWAAGISGTAGQFGLPPAKMKSDFRSLFKELDFSFMGVIEGHYDRYSLFSDIIYTKISTGGQTPYGVLSNSVDIKSETFSGFFGGGYSLLEEGRSRLDVVAGARVWYASTEISFDGGLFDGHSGRDSAAWVDAVAGIRGKYFLTNDLYFSGWGVVGAGQAKWIGMLLEHSDISSGTTYLPLQAIVRLVSTIVTMVSFTMWFKKDRYWDWCFISKSY